MELRKLAAANSRKVDVDDDCCENRHAVTTVGDSGTDWVKHRDCHSTVCTLLSSRPIAQAVAVHLWQYTPPNHDRVRGGGARRSQRLGRRYLTRSFVCRGEPQCYYILHRTKFRNKSIHCKRYLVLSLRNRIYFTVFSIHMLKVF
jgi:hypothetical protein